MLLSAEIGGTTDGSFLRQGQEAQAFISGYTRHRLPYLQVTSAPFLKSVNESMQDHMSLRGSGRPSVNAQVTEAEKAFNQVLTKYSALEIAYMDARMHNENPSTLQQMRLDLSSLNAELVNLAKQISRDIDSLPVRDDEMRNEIKEQQHMLDDYIDQLQADTDKLLAEVHSVSAQQEDAVLLYKSTHLQYLVWLFLSVTVVAITANMLMNDNAQVISGMFIIGLLLFIYVVSKHFGLLYW